MSVVAVVTNPKTRHHRRNPEILPGLAYILGEAGEIVSPTDLDALARTAERFRERDVEIVCVNGGDGTVHQVMTAMVRAYGDRPLPSFVVLRGGTMNIIADSVGVKASADVVLGRLVEAVSRGTEIRSTRRHPIRVDVGSGLPVYGFLCGNGLIARFLEVYYEQRDPTPRAAGWLLLQAAASVLVGGGLARRLTRPYRGQVHIDGEVLPGDTFPTVALGAIEQMGLGFRVFPDVRDDRAAFQYVALGGSMVDVALELPFLYAGRGVVRPGDRTGLAHELRMTSGEPVQLMVDGDFYTAASGEVRFTVGPGVRFLLPA